MSAIFARRSFITAAVAAVALLLAACGDNSSTTTTAPAGSGSTAKMDANTKVKLAFVTNNTDDFWAIARAGVMKAAEEDGHIDADVKMPKDGDAGDQKQIVDALIANGVQGIAI